MEGGFYGKKWMPREYYLSSDGLSEFEIYLRSKDDESITAIKDFESELSIFFDWSFRLNHFFYLVEYVIKEDETEPEIKPNNWKKIYLPQEITDNSKDYLYFSDCDLGCKLSIDFSKLDENDFIEFSDYSFNVSFNYLSEQNWINLELNSIGRKLKNLSI